VIDVDDLIGKRACTMQVWEGIHDGAECFVVQVYIPTMGPFGPVTMVRRSGAQDRASAANLGTVLGREVGAQTFVLLPGSRRCSA